MLHATLKSLLAHKMRMAMSAFAIVLGVAFVAGTLMFSDTLSSSFKDLFRQTAPDVMVRPADAGAASAGGFTSAGTRTVGADVVTLIAAVPGVSRADGSMTNQGTLVVGKNGKVVSSGGGTPGIGGNYNDGPAADGSPIVTITTGRAPTGPGELLIDDKTAATAGYRIGDTVRLVTSGSQPKATGTMVGTLRFGQSGNLVGATLVLMDTPTAQQLYMDGADAFSEVAVTGDGSLSNQQLRDSVTAALPAGLEAVDDEQIAAENQDQIQQTLSLLTTFLLVFAAVSLVVGTFLILNTFSIVVAQRTRELALFRALGASRRQVTRSVLSEALIIGLIGSTVGLLLGFALALGLKALFAAIGLDLTQGGLVFQWRTAAAAYAVGVLVTLLAAYLPARRAAKVPPIAAMRDDVSIPESSMRHRLISGAAVTLVGATLMASALFFDTGLALLGAGVLAVFIGVALLSPAISQPIVTAVAGLYPRLFGTVGTLARENARRNPRRTAATASALMIGLALVTTIAIVGQSTKSSVDELLSTDLRADYIVTSAIQAPFSAAVATEISAVAGVQDAVPFRSAVATVNGQQQSVAAFDPLRFSRVVTLSVQAGDLATPDNGVLVTGARANSEGWKLGDTIPIGFPAGPILMRITAILGPSRALGSDVVVTPGALAAGGIAAVTSVIYITRTPGADTATVSAAIQQVLSDLPTVILQDQAAYAAAARASIDQLLAIVYALLGLAVIIAVLGIVNTLALSVIERTREVGLLRAVGMSRRQLRSMIRLESVAISVLGAILGIGLGLIFGISLQRAMSGQGVPVLSIPAGQLGAFVAVAALVGVLAAVFPARRAARMDVLRAISTQ
jgi:putative ABC transport system permease protein